MALLALLGPVGTFALVATRVAGFVVASPFPGERVHPTARVALVVVLAFLVTAAVPPPARAPELGIVLIIPATIEFLCGLLIGACFRFLLAAAEVTGGTAAQSAGLGTASLFDPATGIPDSTISRAIGLLAMAIAIAGGAHRVAIAYVIESFRALPVGGPIDVHLGAPVIIDLVGRCISVGVRLALPAIAVALALQAVLAMVARAAPSLQIFSIGFSVLLAAGLAVLVASLPAIATGLAEQVATLGATLDRLFEQLGGT